MNLNSHQNTYIYLVFALDDGRVLAVTARAVDDWGLVLADKGLALADGGRPLEGGLLPEARFVDGIEDG